MTLDAVVFDFDGVLADTEPLHLRVYQELLAEDGLSLSPAEYYEQYLGFDDVGVFAALARDKGLRVDAGRMETLIARKTAIYQRVVETAHVLFPGAVECLTSMAASVPVAIASGALRAEIELILGSAGLTRVVSALVAAGETPRGKPAPDPYQKALQLLSERHGRSIVASRSVAIEDSRWGLESARAAGMRTIGLTTSYRADELGEPDLVLPDISHVSRERLDRLLSVTPTPAGRS